MTWSERQRLMLEAMGLKIWVPPTAGADHATPPAGAPHPARDRAAATRPGDDRPAGSSAAMADQADVVVMAPERPPVSAPAAGTPARPPAPAVHRDAGPRESGAAEPPAPRRVAEVLARALPAGVPGAAPDQPTEGARQRPALAPEAIATLDWDGLREAVAGCQACGLCESRKNTVFGVGHPKAHWMIVGEAPGEQEDLRGEPFVGNAGKLLDNMLRALGLSREEGPPERQVYIANTLKCRPPRNRNPDPSELAQCEPFLQRQIELIQPRIILAMGRFAVQQLLQSQEAIGRLRGRVHRYQGVPLVVTYHPAYLLRNLPDKARAWEDLCLAQQTLDAAG